MSSRIIAVAATATAPEGTSASARNCAASNSVERCPSACDCRNRPSSSETRISYPTLCVMVAMRLDALPRKESILPERTPEPASFQLGSSAAR